MKSLYQSDLAYVHDSGFGQLAEDAARFVAEELHRGGLRKGRVVDLGCGSGITAQFLLEAGFQVLGIDASEAMIDLARLRVPDGIFRVGSWVAADIPACLAVMAIGEVLSYRVDPAGQDARAPLSPREELLQRAYGALQPGGLLLFDIATRDRTPSPSPDRTWFEGPDWVVLVESDANEERTLLTRNITTFRRRRCLYRRNVERHQLELLDPNEILELLQRTGFSKLQTLSACGVHPLPEGVIAFLARK